MNSEIETGIPIDAQNWHPAKVDVMSLGEVSLDDGEDILVAEVIDDKPKLTWQDLSGQDSAEARAQLRAYAEQTAEEFISGDSEIDSWVKNNSSVKEELTTRIMVPLRTILQGMDKSRSEPHQTEVAFKEKFIKNWKRDYKILIEQRGRFPGTMKRAA